MDHETPGCWNPVSSLRVPGPASRRWPQCTRDCVEGVAAHKPASVCLKAHRGHSALRFRSVTLRWATRHSEGQATQPQGMMRTKLAQARAEPHEQLQSSLHTRGMTSSSDSFSSLLTPLASHHPPTEHATTAEPSWVNGPRPSTAAVPHTYTSPHLLLPHTPRFSAHTGAARPPPWVSQPANRSTA